MKENQEELLGAVWKKAVGYTSTESVEEHTAVDGQLVLAKQKVVTKEVPPDIAAAKLIMEQLTDPFERLSDEELEKEKERLIKMLKEEKCS